MTRLQTYPGESEQAEELRRDMEWTWLHPNALRLEPWCRMIALTPHSRVEEVNGYSSLRSPEQQRIREKCEEAMRARFSYMEEERQGVDTPGEQPELPSFLTDDQIDQHEETFRFNKENKPIDPFSREYRRPKIKMRGCTELRFQEFAEYMELQTRGMPRPVETTEVDGDSEESEDEDEDESEGDDEMDADMP